MPLQLITIPCLTDNYAYVIQNTDTDETALIDAPETAPIEALLDDNGITLSTILITHHHYDHVDGVDKLREKYGAKVIGPSYDEHRLPALDTTVSDGDSLTICGETCEVFHVPGHTTGHVAFYFPQSDIVFTADSLMAMGCGRLFEGTPSDMWTSLQRLRTLPANTLVCSGHEYTAANTKFAKTIEPENPDLLERAADIATARAEGRPTVPSLLSLELATNPFLRADIASVKAAVGMADASDEDVFAEIRSRKDNF